MKNIFFNLFQSVKHTKVIKNPIKKMKKVNNQYELNWQIIFSRVVHLNNQRPTFIWKISIVQEWQRTIIYWANKMWNEKGRVVPYAFPEIGSITVVRSSPKKMNCVRNFPSGSCSTWLLKYEERYRTNIWIRQNLSPGGWTYF